MPILFDCANCGKQIKAPDQAAGRQVKCPGCKSTILIPGAEPTPKPSLPDANSFRNSSRSEDPARAFTDDRSTRDDERDRDNGGRRNNRQQFAGPGQQISVVVNQAEGKTDAPGVIGLIFGVLSLLCLILVCCTAGLSGAAAIPLALIGVGCAFFGRGNMRVAGIVLNLLTLLPAIALTALFFLGIAGNIGLNIFGTNVAADAAEGVTEGAVKGAARALKAEAEERSAEDNQPITHWIQMLRGSDELASAKARDRLVRLQGRAVPDLRTALKDEDPKLRHAVASILGAIGEHAASAIDDLVIALNDREATVRAAAAQALGQIGKSAHSSLPVLIRSTADVELIVREAAEVAVGLVGPPSQDDISKLMPLWKESDRAKRERYLATLRRLRPDGHVAASLYLPLLLDNEKAIRLSAIQALGEAGPTAHAIVFTKLLAVAASPEPDVCQAALTSLLKVGPATASERRELEAGLRFDSIEARLFCIEQLGQLGEQAVQSAPHLARLLRDPNPKVRAAAARGLGRMGAAGVRNDLVLAARDAEPSVRQAAVETLGKLSRDTTTDGVVFDALNDEVPEVRDAARKILSSLHPRLGTSDQAMLRKALASPRVETRRFAAAEFARLGADAAESRSDLVAAAKDKDADVRRQVFIALSTHGKDAKDAVPELLTTMSAVLEGTEKHSGTLELFRQATATLAKIGDPADALPLLIKGLKCDDEALRKEVIQSLGAIGPRAQKLAKELCSQLSDPALTAVIGETLLKVRGEEVVKALCEIVDAGGPLPARLAAVRVLGQMGKEAKSATQTLFQCWNRNKNKELGTAAKDALSRIQN